MKLEIVDNDSAQLTPESLTEVLDVCRLKECFGENPITLQIESSSDEKLKPVLTLSKLQPTENNLACVKTMQGQRIIYATPCALNRYVVTLENGQHLTLEFSFVSAETPQPPKPRVGMFTTTHRRKT